MYAERALAQVQAVAGPAPPTASVVIYRESLLAISAQDAPLQEIPGKLHEATGASVEAPALDQRVSIEIAPQPPVQAIVELL